MKKYAWLAILVVILIVGAIIYFYFSNSNSNSNYSAQRSSSNTNTESNVARNNKATIVEKEIASYSTVIKNKKDSNRQGNITLTCSSLNNSIIEPGETFSFCDTVGKATTDRGYKEANIIVDGTEIKGLGGGNCQISSTLYNAVLAVPEDLEVVERHPHSASVPYIESGKDAAVSYGSHDFKFKNNSDSTIKIIAQNTTDEIVVKLIKLIKE